MTFKACLAFGREFLLALIFEFALCYAAARYFNADNHLTYALTYFAGLVAFQLALWIKSLTYQTITYYLFRKRLLIAEMEEFIAEYQLPNYPDMFWEIDAAWYLARVERDPNSTRQQVAAVSRLAGHLETLELYGMSGLRRQKVKAFETALQR